MARAKDIILKPISTKDARKMVVKHHYSGKYANNSQFNLGVFLYGRLEGAMQFGPPIDRSKLINLVEGTKWNGFMELNRMALSDRLPRNSESRSISVAMRVLRKYKPSVEWVVSFSDATQCGHGTIYQASGFVLTQVKKSQNLARFRDGKARHRIMFESHDGMFRKHDFLGGRSYAELTGGGYAWNLFLKKAGAKIVPGFQLRYIYFLNKDARSRLTVPILPFSTVDDMQARMYKGKRCVASDTSDTSSDQDEKGRAELTATLNQTTDLSLEVA